MKRFLCFIFILFYGLSAYSFSLKKYQVDNGLSENTVRVIFQDKKGFIWFGTKDGLNRFDGYEYKIFRNKQDDPHSIGNNFIYDIYQDVNENMWIATHYRLYIYDYKKEIFSIFDEKTDEGVKLNSSVTSICEENDSIIWIGTYSQGLFRYNTKTSELLHYFKINPPIIWTIYRDNSGCIWIGSRNNLCRYNQETNNFFFYEPVVDVKKDGENDILAIYEDSDGDLWVGTWATGFGKLNKSTNQFTFYNTNISHVRSFYEYEKSMLYIGADDGLFSFNKKTNECLRIDNPKDPNNLSDQNIYDIYKDREGGLWFGTFFGGANYLSPNTNTIQHYYPNSLPNSLSGKAISQFCEDQDGNFWIATEDGGLNYFDTKKKQFKTYVPQSGKNGLSYHNLHSLALDGDKLWIGTFSKGIDVLNVKTNTFKNYRYMANDSNSINDNCIFSICITSKKEIYAGTPYGLSKYNPDKDNFIRIPEMDKFAMDIKEDYLGYLWVGSYGNGLYRFEPKNKNWKHYVHNPLQKNSISYDKIICISIDDQQRLWIGTEGRGFCKYNYETDDFTTISSEDGLPNDVVYGILDDKYGNVWVSTNGGISKVNLNNKEIKNYTKEDGLQSNQFNYQSYYKSKNGLFYFGGINGFNVFNPNELTNNTFSPQVVITGINLLNENQPQKLKLVKKLKLKHNQASFSIHFVSLSFQVQEKNQYAYLMENLNSKWINVGTQRSVSFINLPPGKYFFRVKGSNNDGVWNECDSVIEVTILPPFWKSIMAYIIYLITFCIGIFFLIQLSNKKTKKKQLKKLEEFNLEKEKEVYNSKINFFTNIAHEIRTPVSLIKAPLETILHSADGTPETRENLSIIEKNADRLLDLINQLLDFRRIENNIYKLQFSNVNVNDLISDIYFRFRTTAEKRGLKMILNLPSLLIYENLDKEAITKIISNLLTNALKYAQTQIVLSLSKDSIEGKDYIEIKVEDDGIGIPEVLKEKIFEPFFQIENQDIINRKNGTGIGLALVKQLVERHSGTISIENKKTLGAIFTVRLYEIPEMKENAVEMKTETDQDLPLPKISVTEEDLNKPLLLIVEDNEELGAFLKRNLSSDYVVEIAENGEKALEILEKSSFDLILSDIVMPVMDGLELCKNVKQNEQFCHIPIVLLSAKTNIQTKVEGLEYGADSYIEKPFSVVFLKAQMSSLIENRRKIMERFSNSPIIPFGSIARSKKDNEFLTKLNDIVEQNIADVDFSVEKLASHMGVSQSYLQRKIKGLSGLVPNDYIRIVKLKKAAILLKQDKYRINEICYIVGFTSPSYFSKCFQKQFGMTPRDYIK